MRHFGQAPFTQFEKLAEADATQQHKHTMIENNLNMNLFMHIQHQLEKVTMLAYDVNKSLATDRAKTPSMNPQEYQTNCYISSSRVRSCTIGAWLLLLKD